MKIYFLPNLDGVNSALVAAKNQEEARRLMHASACAFREFGGRRIREDDPQYERMNYVAMQQPGTVLYCRIFPNPGELNLWIPKRYAR